MPHDEHLLGGQRCNVHHSERGWYIRTFPLLLLMQGVSSEQQAARFVGCEAYMLRTDLPEQAAAHADLDTLTGYLLCDAKRGEVGTITAIDTSTLNTLIQLDNGALLPLHEDLIEQIDINNKRILARLPEGLL